MEASANPESHSPHLDVLSSCAKKFEEVYLTHLAMGKTGYVAHVGDAELIRLSDFKQPYDILLARPRLNNDAGGAQFWIDRIQTQRAPNRLHRYPEVVVIPQDTTQFYTSKTDEYPLVPIGQEASTEIISYMHMAEIIPLD